MIWRSHIADSDSCAKEKCCADVIVIARRLSNESLRLTGGQRKWRLRRHIGRIRRQLNSGVRPLTAGLQHPVVHRWCTPKNLLIFSLQRRVVPASVSPPFSLLSRD